MTIYISHTKFSEFKNVKNWTSQFVIFISWGLIPCVNVRCNSAVEAVSKFSFVSSRVCVRDATFVSNA